MKAMGHGNNLYYEFALTSLFGYILWLLVILCVEMKLMGDYPLVYNLPLFIVLKLSIVCHEYLRVAIWEIMFWLNRQLRKVLWATK